jgi:site-specific DNA recombinase
MTGLSYQHDSRPASLRIPAAEIEKIVIDQIRLLLLSSEIIVQTWRSAHKSFKGMTESEVKPARSL